MTREDAEIEYIVCRNILIGIEVQLSVMRILNLSIPGNASTDKLLLKRIIFIIRKMIRCSLIMGKSHKAEITLLNAMNIKWQEMKDVKIIRNGKP